MKNGRILVIIFLLLSKSDRVKIIFFSKGTFSYRMKGMSEPATDHYPRPFYSALKDINDDGRYNYCTSGRTNIQFVLDYTRDFMQIYKKSGFFALEFLATYSHESSETISYMDDELVKFLGEFKADESLSSNTILSK